MTETMVENPPLETLFAKAHSGDREAFDALMAHYRPRLEAQIRALMGSLLKERFEVEDLYQETVLRALGSLERVTWQGEAKFAGWLRSIAEHLILSASQKRELTRLKLEERDPSGGSSPTRAARRDERFDRLEKAYHHLSPDQRKALALARLEGKKLADVAREMDRSSEAVRKLIARALLQLKKDFGDTESLHLPDRRLDTEDSEESDDHD